MSAGRPLAPVRLLSAANAIVGLVEQRRWRWPIELDERVPRDLAFVHEVGYWSHFDSRSSSSNWPLPEAASVEELAQYAGTSGALREAPLEGDIFLWWSPSKRRFIKTGIVTQVERYAKAEFGLGFWVCRTIEVETRARGRGLPVARLRANRDVSPEMGHRFIRWTSLDGREERQAVIEEALDEAAWRPAA